MSTKIYNAYRAKITSLHDLDMFVKKLKHECQNRIMNDIIPQKMMSALFNLTQIPIYTKVTKTEHQWLKNKKDIYDDILGKNWMTQNPISNVIEIVCSQLQGDNDQLAIFIDQTDIKMIAFGKYLIPFMEEIESRKNNTFQKYCITDFHYQNQSDHPENITEKEWNARIKTWKRLMPSMVPASDGITIDIADNEHIRMKLLTANIDIDERKQMYQKMIQCITNKTYTDIIRQFATNHVSEKYGKPYDNHIQETTQVLQKYTINYRNKTVQTWLTQTEESPLQTRQILLTTQNYYKKAEWLYDCSHHMK